MDPSIDPSIYRSVAASHSASVSPAVRPSVPRVPAPAPSARAPMTTVSVRYRVDVRVPDGQGFAPFVAATMTDPRGWKRARFDIREDPDADFVVVLAEGDEVDRLCKPYDTFNKYSCQNGPVVAINAERWREGVEHWPYDLDHYRTMIVNHEMGHLLGQRHRTCPGPGRTAPEMQPQSGSLHGCRANAWPLDDEIARAARHDLKLAPAYGE